MEDSMSGLKAVAAIQDLFSQADIHINGSRPWDIAVTHPRFYERVLSGGSLALGESYMDGWWECPALDRFFARILENRIEEKAEAVVRTLPWNTVKAVVQNAQSRSKAFIIGKRHYDLGNSLFTMMLDPALHYSCGYWEKAETLDQAQAAKCDLICRKLGVTPGMKILDIGCGWGGFAHHAATKYGARVTGLTVSREQARYAAQCCHEEDVEIALRDYRDAEGEFDRVVSIGMFEHVGYKNYRTYFETIRRRLNPEGLFLLHTIGRNTSARTVDPWIEKYIFPNSMLPSAAQITTAAEGLLVLEDWHCFGEHYDRTLMAWYENFSRNWDLLKNDHDERFRRMWTYYLLSCAGAFRAGKNQVWQIVFSKEGMNGRFQRNRPFPEASIPDQ